MPARMHSEYLRHLFLNNELSKARYELDGRNVALTDIRCPIYCVGTETDHVSPWRSVYKLLLLTDTDVTFVLTNGGHNGGILSEPGHKGRRFRRTHKTEGDQYTPPQVWIEGSVPQAGTWWANWSEWLRTKNSDRIRSTENVVVPLGKAPGMYVMG